MTVTMVATEAVTRPAASTGLVVTLDRHGVLVRNPRSRRTFRLGVVEARVLQLCDGERTLSEVKATISPALSGHDVEKLLLILEQKHLVGGADEVRRRTWLQLRVLSFAVHRLLRKGTATRVASWALLLCTVASATLLGLTLSSHFLAVLHGLFTNDYLQWRTLPIYLVSVLVVGFIHESAHALVIVDQGGTVFEVGFMLNYFNPAFYVDVTGLQRLTQRRSRIAVWVAGLAAQTLLLGPGVWEQYHMRPSGFWYSFLVTFNAVNCAIFVLNSAFFIRMDGYHLISELAEMKDLQGNARRFLLQGDPSEATTTVDRCVYAISGILLTLWIPVLAVNIVLTVAIHFGVPRHVVADSLEITLPTSALAGLARLVWSRRRTRAQAATTGAMA
jgi:putative peptide zinc metalloprotease protein